MAKDPSANESGFDKLLDWLDSNRESAGNKYELIRLKLTKMFNDRGAYPAEDLVDETIERVTRKIDTIAPNYEGNPALYFYAVAKNVFLEFTREPKFKELPQNLREKKRSDNILEKRDQCLSKCMDNFSPENSKLILNYFKGEKQEKISRRKKMAEELGINQETLRVRVFRIKKILRKCVLDCLKKKDDEMF